jgi:hypothetical protein
VFVINQQNQDLATLLLFDEVGAAPRNSSTKASSYWKNSEIFPNVFLSLFGVGELEVAPRFSVLLSRVAFFTNTPQVPHLPLCERL